VISEWEPILRAMGRCLSEWAFNSSLGVVPCPEGFRYLGQDEAESGVLAAEGLEQ
jgi:hypothetical protein